MRAPTPTKAGPETLFPRPYKRRGRSSSKLTCQFRHTTDRDTKSVDSPRERHPDGIPKSLKCFTKGYSRGDDFCVRALLIPKSCPYDSCRYLSKPVGPNTSQRPGTVGIVSPRCSVSPSPNPVSNDLSPIHDLENYMYVSIKAMLGVIAWCNCDSKYTLQNTRRHDLNVNSDRYTTP